MLNVSYETDSIGEMVVHNSYKNLDEIKEVMASEKETCFIVITQKLNDDEELTLSLEVGANSNELYYNTYVFYEEYLPWIEDKVNLSDFNSIDELLEDMKHHFKYNYAIAVHERIMHGDDEDLEDEK